MSISKEKQNKTKNKKKLENGETQTWWSIYWKWVFEWLVDACARPHGLAGQWVVWTREVRGPRYTIAGTMWALIMAFRGVRAREMGGSTSIVAGSDTTTTTTTSSTMVETFVFVIYKKIRKKTTTTYISTPNLCEVTKIRRRRAIQMCLLFVVFDTTLLMPKKQKNNNLHLTLSSLNVAKIWLPWSTHSKDW